MQMRNSIPDSIETARGAERLARSLRGEALARGNAVVVGSRAGIVEWADPSWQVLTGFPLEQTLDKPISHFLEQAGLEVELVEFVAGHFLQGLRCEVALTFDTLDGRTLDLHLEVEPLRNRSGEVDRFVAVVREQPPLGEDGEMDQRRREPISRAPDATTTSATRRPSRRRARHLVQIEPLLLGTLERMGVSDCHETYVDLSLDALNVPTLSRAPGSAGRAIASARLSALLDRLLGSSLAAEATGPRHLTLITGNTRPGRSHHSLAHAIPQRATAGLAGSHPFLEFHDTAGHLDRTGLDRVRVGLPGDDPREVALCEAGQLAQQLGARLLLDSTPGCGNQALVVFEWEPEPSLRPPTRSATKRHEAPESARAEETLR
jgi:hypothetical protein